MRPDQVSLTYKLYSGSKAINFGQFVVEPNCGYSFDKISSISSTTELLVDYIDCNFDQTGHFEDSFYGCNILTSAENQYFGNRVESLRTELHLTN